MVAVGEDIGRPEPDLRGDLLNRAELRLLRDLDVALDMCLQGALRPSEPIAVTEPIVKRPWRDRDVDRVEAKEENHSARITAGQPTSRSSSTHPRQSPTRFCRRVTDCDSIAHNRLRHQLSS